MIRLSGPRCLAMSVVGVLFGWWANLSSTSTMTHYRGLSHEALLTELAKTNDGALSTSIIGGLVVVAAVVIATDILTRFFKAVWLRIEPRSPTTNSTPEEAA
jgi:hypothetical protein